MTKVLNVFIFFLAISFGQSFRIEGGDHIKGLDCRFNCVLEHNSIEYQAYTPNSRVDYGLLATLKYLIYGYPACSHNGNLANPVRQDCECLEKKIQTESIDKNNSEEILTLVYTDNHLCNGPNEIQRIKDFSLKIHPDSSPSIFPYGIHYKNYAECGAANLVTVKNAHPYHTIVTDMVTSEETITTKYVKADIPSKDGNFVEFCKLYLYGSQNGDYHKCSLQRKKFDLSDPFFYKNYPDLPKTYNFSVDSKGFKGYPEVLLINVYTCPDDLLSSFLNKN